MRVLLACEFSGIVRDAFTDQGHYAVSCDLLGTEREGYHYQGDVLYLLRYEWDLMIAFPPCTYLTAAGAHLWKQRETEQVQALAFVRALMDAPIPRIAIENPQGRINSAIRKPDQTIQPYQFGDPYTKRTCLWLKNLPNLVPTNRVTPVSSWTDKFAGNGGRNQGNRSRTFQGIATAMAEQWGALA